MTLKEKFIKAVREQYLFAGNDQLILAVSGGLDSVVLCELCHQSGFSFSIAHCNFQLRGEESERDEQFVKRLGQQYGAETRVKKFNTEHYAAEHKLSIQEAARILRYEWFDELVKTLNPEPSTLNPEPSTLNSQPLNFKLLTAHHADDNNETLLMNFFRGTGLHGLTGIPASYGYIKRPLLGFFKEELLRFAKENKLAFVEDSSNQSSKYTRNFFRNEIIPAISRAYPQVKENLQDNISRFKEVEKLYLYSVGELKKKWCRQKGEELHIPVKQLMQFDSRALIYEIIREYGFGEKQVDELIKLAASESGKFIESPGPRYRVIKHRHWFIISPVQPAAQATIAIREEDRTIEYGGRMLQLQPMVFNGQQPPAAAAEAWLDARELCFPLILRKWKTGDYFYPLGMKKKKKLSRFFIDQKLSKSAKENIWVLESNKRIAWVTGYRIDERFKLTARTRSAWKLTISGPA
ncbi:MAG: tRNA lysidine(34) synthetase TilS [Sphingobacteriales bacterium]|nr:tRNA lysidine(34) synthetase TilS [Sphingobacteriales bacterium]